MLKVKNSKAYKPVFDESFNFMHTEEFVNYINRITKTKLYKEPIHGIEVEDAQQDVLEYVCRYLPSYNPQRASLVGYIDLLISTKLIHIYNYVNAAIRRDSYKNMYIAEEGFVYQCSSDDFIYLDESYQGVEIKLDLFYYAELTNFEIELIRLLNAGYTKKYISNQLDISFDKINTTIKIIKTKYLGDVKVQH